MSAIFLPGTQKVEGSLTISADKSLTHRALIFSAMGLGESVIDQPLACADTEATVRLLRSLGTEIDCPQQGAWRVRSKGMLAFQPPHGILDAGNSGTTCRLLLGVLAAQPFRSELTGDESLRRRPMNRVLAPLQRMGGRFESQQGKLPITVLPAPELGLRPIHYESPIASAQVKSACLLAGLYARGVTSVSEPRKSRDHTERLLSALIPVRMREEGDPLSSPGSPTRFVVEVTGPIENLPAFHYQIPGDFSSAAFFLVAASILPHSNLEIRGVGVNPTRIGLQEILQRMGGHIEQHHPRDLQGEPVADLRVTYAPLKSVHVSGEETLRAIDEIPIWALAAALADGVSVLSDAEELRVKESDRLDAIAEILKRLGVTVEGKADGLVIHGPKDRRLQHPQVSGYGPGYLESFGDHRIAMMACVAALAVPSPTPKKSASGPVEIRDTACIETSFPGFQEILRQVMKKGETP